ncbi:SRPBCC family protein [Comamonas sp. E6]|uniref:SRPBCC family protein n=1 Tax=Comamonas sp. E6 TaxID=364029 RepID=UPI000638260F|nr:SRPBCC family protein [Comamonas sp. E6]GAO70262.1 activator of HSP90 ATPase [Comamonas sp. E6]
MPQTIRLHRVIKAPPERVYRAFTTPEAMVKWLPPHGFAAQVHELDARVGGRYRMSFINFSANSQNSFGGEFLELVPGQRIRHTDRFEDPNLPGEMITTVNLKAVFCGTELHVVQEGVPDVIPEQACYLGWQESLQLLALLVEPSIPDGA